MSSNARVFLTHEAMKSHDFVEMPLEQVPAGFIEVHMKDHGHFYVDPHWLTPSTEPRHPPFTGELTNLLLDQLASGIGEAMEMDIAKWELGFRCDTKPWGEITEWERVAQAMRRFTGHLVGQDDLTKQKRSEVFAVLAQFMNTQPPKGRQVAYQGIGTLTAKRVKEIADWFFSDDRSTEMGAFRRRVRKLIFPNGMPGPDRVPIAALFGADDNSPNLDSDYDPRDLIDECDVIVAVDVDTNSRHVVYGRAILERIATTGQSEPARSLIVEIDDDTDELERIAALVLVMKGRHDLQ